MSDRIDGIDGSDKRTVKECIACRHYGIRGATESWCRKHEYVTPWDDCCADWDKRIDPVEAVTPESIDPKGAAGAAKTPMQLLPPWFLAATCRVLALGGKKYGPWNWRHTGVKLECQTYVAAIMRHLMAYQDGEDIDPESGESHIAHIAASCAILIDAGKHGTLADNRPPRQVAGLECAEMSKIDSKEQGEIR